MGTSVVMYHGYNSEAWTRDPMIGLWNTQIAASTYETSGNRTLNGYCPQFPDLVRWSNATLESWNSGVNIGNMTVKFANDNSTWGNAIPYTDLQMISNTSSCVQLIPNVTTGGLTITPRISNISINYDMLELKPQISDLTINSSSPTTNTTDTDIECSFKPISFFNVSMYANITWWVNNINNQTTSSIGLTNNTQITTNLSNSITHRLDSVKCDVKIWDDVYSSYQSNSSAITIRNSIPTEPNVLSPANNTNTIYNNYTLFCQNSTDADNDAIRYSIFGDSNNPPTTLLQNTTSTSYNWVFTTVGTKWWYCKADDSIGISNSTSTRKIYTDWREEWNNATTKIPLKYEGESTYLELNLTVNPLIVADVSSTIILNHTIFTTTSQVINTTDYRMYANVYAPIGIINNTEVFNYDFNVSLAYLNGTQKLNNLYSNSMNVSKIDFHYCTPDDGKPYLNITYKDETTGNFINATINTMNLNYTLNPDYSGNKQSGNKQFTFTNITNSFSFPFCFSPQNKTIYTTLSMTYLNLIDGYPQKMYQNNLALTNTTNNLTLQLIQTAYGQYVTFQVVNLADQTLSDVNVQVKLSGTTISTQTTDSAGGVTFFLNPNNQYNLIFNKTGYDVYATNLYPTQSSYTITLTKTSAGGGDSTNYIQGISYTIEPNQDVLDNNTEYNFNFTIDSGTYDLDYAGFRLWNKTNSLLDSATCVGSGGCFAHTHFNTGNNTKIRMEYYWVIEGNSYNQSRSWMVTGNDYKGESNVDWLKKDIAVLSDKAFGGGTHAEFTKALIAFIITVIVVGSISLISGLYSPFAVAGETLFMVAIFDVLGFIPTLGLPPSGTPHFITILIGIITIGIFIYEYINR